MRPSLWIAAAAQVAAVGCTSTGSLGSIERSLASARAGRWSVDVIGVRTGYRSQRGGMRFGSSDVWNVDIYVRAHTEKAPAPFEMGRVAHADFGDGERSRAEDFLRALEVEQCADAERFAFRVRGVEGMGREFRVLYAFPTVLAPLRVTVPAMDCQAALAAAPTRDAWLGAGLEGPSASGRAEPPLMTAVEGEGKPLYRRRHALEDEAAFIAATREGLRLEDALRHSLLDLPVYLESAWDKKDESDAGGSYASMREERARLLAAVARGPAGKPDLEAAVLASLSPRADAPWLAEGTEPTSWALALLAAAPTAERRLAFSREGIRACHDASLARICTPWRLRAMSEVARTAQDAPLCDGALELAELSLARKAKGAEASALALLAGAWPCASAEVRRRAALAALHPELEEPLSGPSASCQIPSLAPAGQECPSLPFFAASALVQACDAPLVEAATGMFAATSPWQSRAAILCVIARCGGREAYARLVPRDQLQGKVHPLTYCGLGPEAATW